MYNCALYAYLAYKVYEYSNIMDNTFFFLKGVKYMYRLARPISIQEDEDYKYIDWVLITDDKDSLLKKEYS